MSRFGRFGRVNPNAPEAAGVCDRGGEIRKRRDLFPEMEWRGGRLVPNGFLVCRHHMDRPNPQIGGQLPIGPDPVPVRDPRPLPSTVSGSGPTPTPDPGNTLYVLLLDQHSNPLLDVDGRFLYALVTGPIPQ